MKMRPIPSVRPFRPDEWRSYRDLRLRALADAPDAFGSTLAREGGRPDAEWQERLASAAASDHSLPLVAEDGGERVGLAWGRIGPEDPSVAHVFQMWVAPGSRGRGIGRMLLDALVAWARERGAREVRLGVTCGDSPARRMYERAGFRAWGEPEPLRPGAALRSQPMRRGLGAAVA